MKFTGIRKLVLTLSICSIALGAAFPQACFGTVIQAGIEHKEYLPPVDQSFRAGTTFSAPPQAARVQWFPVPDWLAGAWLKNGDMETYVKDYRSGEEMRKPMWLNNKVRLAFGHQRDKLGTIWHAEVLPFRADGNRGETTDRRYVMDMSCLKSNPDAVVLRFHSNVVHINPTDSRIQTTTQQEEIVTFRPDQEGMIATTSSTKTFDENGRPIIQALSNAERTKLAEFAPVPVINGIDLVQSLDSFLASNQMTNRLPN